MIKISTGRFYKTLRPGDADFTFNNGIVVVPRAGLEITKNCPGEHKWIIQQCIENGWIKPVAHMRDTEYTWEVLQK
jgi:hypothetical protein